MSDTVKRVHELGRRWARAEEQGDDEALDALTADDFSMVGPTGVVITKQEWLDRYRHKGLVTRSLVWDKVKVRDYGDAAVAVGVHDQQTEINGKPIRRKCCTTLIAVRLYGEWVIAGMHLSPMR